jgi:protocatechuate 3,4-dioxygenase beta subunit
MVNDPVDPLRRRVLYGMAALPVAGFSSTTLSSTTLSSTTLATSAVTPSASEGPFYPPAHMRFDDVDRDLIKIVDKLEQSGGEIVILAGRVLDAGGNPIPGARIEIWQCDVNGRYLHRADQGETARDVGFQGFGHDISGTDGSYAFRTIKPVPYTGRTPHIHVKVLIDNRERLTTQFYLADHPGNARDWLYRRVPVTERERVTLRFEDKTDNIPQARLDIVV